MRSGNHMVQSPQRAAQKRDYKPPGATLRKHQAHAKIMVRGQSELRDLMKRGVQTSIGAGYCKRQRNHDFFTARGDVEIER